MIIAADLDGVLCWNLLDKSKFKPYRLYEFYAACWPAPCHGMHFQYIITGRKIHYRKLTERWLIENNIQFENLIMLPNKLKKNYRNIVKFKANMINNLEIDIYYEDDVEIVKYLEKHCKNTKIILVKFLIDNL